MSLLGSFSRSTSTPSSSLLVSRATDTAIARVMTLLCPSVRPHTATSSSCLPHPPHLPRPHHHTPHTPHTPHTHTPHQKHRRHSRSLHTRAIRPRPWPRPDLHVNLISPDLAESVFLHALTRASLCKKHARSTSYASHAALRSRPQPPLPRNSSIHSNIRHHGVPVPRTPTTTHHLRKHSTQAAPAQKPISRHELRDLVHLYDFEQDVFPPPSPSRHAPRQPLKVPVEDIPSSLTHPEINLTPAAPCPPPREYPPDKDLYSQHIQHLVSLLADFRTSHDLVYDAYHKLPHPRISYLSTTSIRRLMQHFSVVEYKDEHSMLRYLSLVDDLTIAGIPLIISEWNTAIAFAGRWVRRVSDSQVETATRIWLSMERDAKVKSDNVTFNILFDIASKAGKFALADVIINEMAIRGMEENRLFRTNKIFYYGLKRDGASVRRAYQDLVDAGDFVDTIVLNCVIASLIKAGEPSAAEHVFERMKLMHDEKSGQKPLSGGWRKQRNLGRILDLAAKALRQDPKRKAAVQDASPVAPNMHTYRLLIKYHSQESGNIDRITELLDDMHRLQFHIHGSIFFHLFQGFSLHGGVRYSSWTKSRLDKVWSIFLEFIERSEERANSHPGLLDEEDRGCYFDSPIIIVALQAFDKIAGTDAVMEVWSEISSRWESPEPKALDAVNAALANMVSPNGQ